MLPFLAYINAVKLQYGISLVVITLEREDFLRLLEGHPHKFGDYSPCHWLCYTISLK